MAGEPMEMKVSVVIPAYFEEKTISEIVKKHRTVLLFLNEIECSAQQKRFSNLLPNLKVVSLTHSM